MSYQEKLPWSLGGFGPRLGYVCRPQVLRHLEFGESRCEEAMVSSCLSQAVFLRTHRGRCSAFFLHVRGSQDLGSSLISSPSTFCSTLAPNPHPDLLRRKT